MPKEKFECDKCPWSKEKKFNTQKGLEQHIRIKHPYVAPPAPKKETVYVPNDLEEDHSLADGKEIQIGDLIWLGRKCVVTKITKTEGTKDVEVTLKITKKWYSKNPL